MSIQPSILIWTIICFCLLMLILNKLLFQPMLKCMDARQARIDGAKAKKQRNAEAYEAALQALKEQQEEEDKRRVLEAASAAEQAQKRAEAQIAEAKQNHEQEIMAYRDVLIAESHELNTKLDAGMDALAATFADRLAS